MCSGHEQTLLRDLPASDSPSLKTLLSGTIGNHNFCDVLYTELLVLINCFCLCVVLTKPPYEVRETGWGEFEIQIKIYFQDSLEKPVSGGYG